MIPQKKQFRIFKSFGPIKPVLFVYLLLCQSDPTYLPPFVPDKKKVKLTPLPFPFKNLSNWHCLYRFRCMELTESTRTPLVPYATRPSLAATVWPDTCWPILVKNPLFATLAVQHTIKELIWIPTKSKTTTYESGNYCASLHVGMQDGQRAWTPDQTNKQPKQHLWIPLWLFSGLNTNGAWKPRSPHIGQQKCLFLLLQNLQKIPWFESSSYHSYGREKLWMWHLWDAFQPKRQSQTSLHQKA